MAFRSRGRDYRADPGARARPSVAPSRGSGGYLIAATGPLSVLGCAAASRYRRQVRERRGGPAKIIHISLPSCRVLRGNAWNPGASVSGARRRISHRAPPACGSMIQCLTPRPSNWLGQAAQRSACPTSGRSIHLGCAEPHASVECFPTLGMARARCSVHRPQDRRRKALLNSAGRSCRQTEQ